MGVGRELGHLRVRERGGVGGMGDKRGDRDVGGGVGGSGDDRRGKGGEGG